VIFGSSSPSERTQLLGQPHCRTTYLQYLLWKDHAAYTSEAASLYNGSTHDDKAFPIGGTRRDSRGAIIITSMRLCAAVEQLRHTTSKQNRRSAIRFHTHRGAQVGQVSGWISLLEEQKWQTTASHFRGCDKATRRCKCHARARTVSLLCPISITLVDDAALTHDRMFLILLASHRKRRAHWQS